MRRRSSFRRRSYRTSKTSRTVVPEPSGRDQTSSMISASRSPRTLRMPGRSGRNTLISGSKAISQLLLVDILSPLADSIKKPNTLVKRTIVSSMMKKDSGKEDFYDERSRNVWNDALDAAGNSVLPGRAGGHYLAPCMVAEHEADANCALPTAAAATI